MYVCMYVCMYVMYVCMYVCIYAYMTHFFLSLMFKPELCVCVIFHVCESTTKINNLFIQLSCANLYKGLLNNYVTLSCLYAEFPLLIFHVQLSFQPLSNTRPIFERSLKE